MQISFIIAELLRRYHSAVPGNFVRRSGRAQKVFGTVSGIPDRFKKFLGHFPAFRTDSKSVWDGFRRSGRAQKVFGTVSGVPEGLKTDLAAGAGLRPFRAMEESELTIWYEVPADRFLLNYYSSN
jgi:hypothetical protein